MSAVVLVAAIELFTHGRLSDNVWGLRSAGFGGLHAILHTSPRKLRLELRQSGDGVPVVAALVAASYVVAGVRRRLTTTTSPSRSRSRCSSSSLADIGAEENHLIDIQVLGALVIGTSLAVASRLYLALGGAMVAVAMASLYTGERSGRYT